MANALLGQDLCPAEHHPTAERCLGSFFPVPGFLLFHKMAMQSNHLPQPQVDALSSPLPSSQGGLGDAKSRV